MASVPAAGPKRGSQPSAGDGEKLVVRESPSRGIGEWADAELLPSEGRRPCPPPAGNRCGGRLQRTVTRGSCPSNGGGRRLPEHWQDFAQRLEPAGAPPPGGRLRGQRAASASDLREGAVWFCPVRASGPGRGDGHSVCDGQLDQAGSRRRESRLLRHPPLTRAGSTEQRRAVVETGDGELGGALSRLSPPPSGRRPLTARSARMSRCRPQAVMPEGL